MNIIINDERKIDAVQKDFNKVFPYLRVEFFSKSHKLGDTGAKKFVKPHAKKLGECRITSNNVEIVISPEMTVNDLEQSFGNTYGLGVLIFRQSGRVWLETTVTDSWTLKEQNRQGEDLSRDIG